MKKLFVLVLCVLFTRNMFAQSFDAILTLDRLQILCSIVEISDNDIKYIASDASNDQISVIQKSNVAKIFFKNGIIMDFTRGGLITQQPVRTGSDTVVIAQKRDIYSTAAAPSQPSSPSTQKSENSVTTQNYSVVSRDGNHYICDGKRMNKKEFMSFLDNRCPIAYYQFSSGYKTSLAGWTLFSIGLVLDFSCTIAILANPRADSGGITAVSIIGGAFELACIPTLAVGYGKMHRSAQTYNSQCTTKSTSYWSLQLDNYGLGLAYHF